MLKLMKYEARRQLFSKGVILGVCLVLVTVFFIFGQTGNVAGMGTVLALMGVGTTCVMLFAPTEHWLLFYKDINSRQGDMQFLLPKKATAILGAKVLVSLLQTVILYGLFFTVVPYCERLAVNNYGFATGQVGKILDTIIEMMHSANATLTPVIGVWLSLLVTVLLFSNLGLFIMTIPLPLGLDKLRGMVRVAGYIVAFALITFVEIKIKDLLLFITSSPTVGDVFEIVYLIGVNLALFFGTAKLLDKKMDI